MDEIIRQNDGMLSVADVYLYGISDESDANAPFTFNVSKVAYDLAVESLLPRIVRAAIAMVKAFVYFPLQPAAGHRWLRPLAGGRRSSYFPLQPAASHRWLRPLAGGRRS
jgi:hypothetical protein